MIRNYIKIAWRNIIHNKSSSAINIGGLAVGMTVVILISLWIYNELSFNKYHENYDRIAQVWQHNNYNGNIGSQISNPAAMAGAIRDEYGSDFKYVIQASWNWPHNIKDMEVYGTTGYVFCENGTQMKLMENEKEGAKNIEAKSLPSGLDDPFSLLKKILHENHRLADFDVTTLDNNKIVVQILEAARQSAEQHKTIYWKDLFPTE